MNKLLITFLAICFLAVNVDAQNPKKLAKEAMKSMAKYNSDPIENADLYDDAMSALEQAFEDPAFAAEAKSWIQRGDFYAELSESQLKATLLDPNVPLKNEEAALTAFDSYQKGLELSLKKGDKKKAVAGLIRIESQLSNYGSQLYQLKNFKKAFQNFEASLKAKDLLSENDAESRLDDEAVYNDQIFFTAISGYYGDEKEAVKPYYMQIYENGTDEATIYDGLYNMHKESDPEAALKFLDEGREKFPEDSGLLFAEINYYLEANETEKLIEKLQFAKEKEPNNLSVITTLGSVYDNLSTTYKTNGDSEKSAEYFELAKATYDEVLAVDADNFMATYSIGALYYNQAANMTADINELSNDFSPAGTKKYNDLKQLMDDKFEIALPYFIKAEKLNGTDTNTLIALKEIYARQNEFEKVAEYKGKLESAGISEEGN